MGHLQVSGSLDGGSWSSWAKWNEGPVSVLHYDANLILYRVLSTDGKLSAA